MTKRDLILLNASLLLLVGLFSPLLIHPGSILGNFGDIYSYHYPLRHLVTATLQEGRLPLWNPYIFAGTPLAANPQAVLFYPISLLHYFLPLACAFDLDAFFHVGMAVLGAALLLRRWSTESLGAWALSIAYGLSPFLVCRIAQGVPTHLAALSWVPWVWLAAKRKSPLFLGLTLSLQILSGHPQFSMINLVALGIWNSQGWRRNLPTLIGAGMIAIFLDAAQVFPALEFLKHSVRAHWSSQYALGYSFKPSYLLTFLYPNVMGNPFQNGFQFPSSFFEMFRLYIGIIPLTLGFYGLISVIFVWSFPLSRESRQIKNLDPRPRKHLRGQLSREMLPGRLRGGDKFAFRTNFCWILIIIGLFFALGQNNPLYAPFEKLFRLDFLRVPARFSFLVLWGLWMSAAAGWMKLCRFPRRTFAHWRLALALGTVLDLAYWNAPWIYAQNPLDFLSPNKELLNFLHSTPRPQEEGRSDGIYHRIATSPEVPAPNKSMLYRIPNATGYEAFYLAEIAYYTSRSENVPSADGSRTYILHWRTPEMGRLGVRHYISPSPVAGASPAFERNSLYVYENADALPLVQGAETWRALSPEHWAASGQNPATVAFSQAGYPGWKAWINGQPAAVQLEDRFFPSITIPPLTPTLSHYMGEGESLNPPSPQGGEDWTLHFRFIPDLWFIGLYISLSTVLIIAVLAVKRVLT